jgi:hypothetical protein
MKSKHTKHRQWNNASSGHTVGGISNKESHCGAKLQTEGNRVSIG